MKTEASRNKRIFIISLVVAITLFLGGIISNDIGVIGNLTILSIFVIVTPQLLFRYEKYRELKEMEEKFPVFLRDLTESLRSGMPLHLSISNANRIEYGKLSKEIRKMSNQISWGMPVDKVLDQFANRVKKSKRLFTAIKIIRESHVSGGNVVNTLESVADNSTMLEESEKEKGSLLSQYVLLMYAISIIFVVIVSAINKLLIPVFKTSTSGADVLGLSNPCNTCMDISCFVCSGFDFMSKNVFSIDSTSIGAYYTSLFFFMSLIQAIFSGLIAGQISEGSATAGIKHSLILVGIVFGSFSILVKMGFLGV